LHSHTLNLKILLHGMQGTGRPDVYNTAELQEKHPELKEMCAQEWRKHYRSLKTEAQREEARAQRAKQAAEKAQIISKHQAQQRQEKKKQSSRNITSKYADGEQNHFLGLSHDSPLYRGQVRALALCHVV